MRFSKSPVVSGLFLFFALFLTSCTQGVQKISTRPVIKVNDHQMGAKEFSSKLARRLKDLDAFTAKDPATVENAKQEILRGFIIRSLLIDWARQKNLVVSESDVDKAVDQARGQYPDDLSFRRALAEENLSFSEWREEIRYNLIEKAVFSQMNQRIKPPTEEELRRAYEEKKDNYQKKERIWIRQIVTDEESKAEMIRSELKGKDFSVIAKKYSLAPEADQGGLVGWVEKGTVDFFDSVFSLSIGSVSPIIKSPFGYHLIKVEKKLPASRASFDEMRPQISRDLLAQREQAEFVSWLDGQIRSSQIQKDQDLLKSIVVETRSRDD